VYIDVNPCSIGTQLSTPILDKRAKLWYNKSRQDANVNKASFHKRLMTTHKITVELTDEEYEQLHECLSYAVDTSADNEDEFRREGDTDNAELEHALQKGLEKLISGFSSS